MRFQKQSHGPEDLIAKVANKSHLPVYFVLSSYQYK